LKLCVYFTARRLQEFKNENQFGNLLKELDRLICDITVLPQNDIPSSFDISSSFHIMPLVNHAMPRRATPMLAMPCPARLATPRPAEPRRAVLRHAMPCHASPHHA